MRRRFLYLLLTSATALAAPIAPKARIEIHGHRGARAMRPENTLPAFEYALEQGVDLLEMDMAVTRDGVIVISHDPHINPEICLGPDGKRLTQGPLIHDLSLAEVKRYDCGTLKHPRFAATQQPVPGTRIPTLKEVFELVRTSKAPAARTVRLNIETKIFADHPEYTVGPERFMKLVLKEFRASHLLKRIVLQSFDPRTLVIARRDEPGLPRSMLVEDPAKDLVAVGREVSAQIVSPDWELLTADKVAKLHEAGFEVHPWTPDDEAAWAKLVAMKVDGIITDDPAGLKNYLAAQQKRQ